MYNKIVIYLKKAIFQQIYLMPTFPMNAVFVSIVTVNIIILN